jgi:ribosomal protein S12
MAKSAAWTRKAGKAPSGGLNEKGRKSYERQNPGSDLKAPQPEGGPRKRSFCARMEGMKKKLTSSKTAKDPNSRINKSLRKWKC